MPVLRFDQVLTGHYGTLLLSGIATTLLVSVLAWLLAFGVALLLTALRSASPRAGALAAQAYVEYHRNIPLLVQLLIWYFVIPSLLPQPVQRWINAHGSEFVFATVALGLGIAAYMAEDIRSGLRAVAPGQMDAARALGLSFTRAMMLVILPQALRNAVPPLISDTVLLFKNSSLAAAIGVAELSYQARQIEYETFRVFESLLIATVLYLCISLGLMTVGRAYQVRGLRRLSARPA